MLNKLLPFLTNHAARAIPLALTAALTVKATAQNLVVNGSFEDTVNCGIPTQCTLLKAAHWYNPTLSTPDVYDEDTLRNCGYTILSAANAYMSPHDGSRMVGAFFWDGPSGGPTREYLAEELAETLFAGTAYEVSLWYTRHRAYQAAVDHIGMWFGMDSLFEPTGGPLSVIPQLKLRDPSSEYLVEGNEWTQLVDTIIAQGGERSLAIGNFDPQDSLHGIIADPGAPYSNCYYYIDGVEVRQIASSYVPQIASPFIHWTVDGLLVRWNGVVGPVEAELLDASGRLLRRTTLRQLEGEGELPVGSIPAGLYLLRLQAKGKVAVVKFVKGEGE